MRKIPVVVAALVLVLGAPTSVGAAPWCWPAPVDAPIARPFEEPECPYCAGNRGIEYDTVPGTPVRAVAAGTVTFSGVVAGESYVVVRLVNGWRVTYGRLAERFAAQGEPVMSGQQVGTTGSELFVGLRDGSTYLDPAPYLGELRTQPRLVPLDGTPPRPTPPSKLTCLNT